MKRIFCYVAVIIGLAMLPSLVYAETKPYGLSSEFWTYWSDGYAELSGYRLKYPRYGKIREGTAVLIFVKENMALRNRVKPNAGRHPRNEIFPVMKLNLVQDFQTGIYDYNMMSSSFIVLSAPQNNTSFPLFPGTPAKISFSSQEWCGHVYQQLLFDERKIRSASHSYFDGEADSERILSSVKDGLSEDVLYQWARMFAAPQLSRGDERTIPFLGSMERARLEHGPLGWGTAKISLASDTETIEVPAGSFEVEKREVHPRGGRKWTFYTEVAFPHRLVSWQREDGLHAELLKDKRLKYWEMTGPQFEKSVAELGL